MDDLSALESRFWGEPGSGPVRVTRGALPAGYTLVEEYAVVPGFSRARFLVPVAAPRAVAAAFSTYLSTGSRSSRVTGRALSATFRVGAGTALFRDRLRVGIDAQLPREEWRRHLLMQELAVVLDVPDLVGIHPVRRSTPNAKPTVRLFDRAGRPRGYAKIGWSAPTAALVRNEAQVLRELDGDVGGLLVPRADAAGQATRGGAVLDYLVASPLPPHLKPWSIPPEARPRLLLDLAATGEVSHGPLAASGYAQLLRDRLAAASAAEPDTAGALTSWLERLARNTTPLAFGRWHGDWVAWNLAAVNGSGAVWDWEYSAPNVPVGFDLLHWHFQHALADPQATLVSAARVLDTKLENLACLGVAPEARGLVGSLYLLEMLTRATGLAAEGAGWNPKLQRHLYGFATGRDA